MLRATRVRRAALAAAVLAVSGTPGLPPSGAAVASPVAPPVRPASALPATAHDDTPAASRFVPVGPCRLLDTRSGLGATPASTDTMRVGTRRCDVPADAVAIVATTTIVHAERTGWLVAVAGGAEPANAATLNWSAGETRGNSATVALGPDGTVDIVRSNGNADGDLVVDVTGAFVPVAAAEAGRLVSLGAGRRLVDTRSSDPLAAGDVLTLDLPDEVPDDATAMALTVTAVGTSGPLHVTAYPANSPRPVTSLLNADAAGQIRSAATIVPVTPDGVEVYVSGATDLTVDATGWFTGDSAASSTDGLFVPATPVRLRDTRPEVHPIHPGGTIEVGVPAPPIEAVDDTTTDPTSVSAVAVSTTIVRPQERGFLTAHAARTRRGPIASGYALDSEVTAQFGVIPVSETGLAVYAQRGADVTVDLLGWFLGPAAAETRTEPAPNPVGTQRVLAVGDSTMAGVRWYRALGALRGASWTFDGESCRRLVAPSCRGREGRRPPTAVESILSRPAVFDVVVVMTGYNDAASTFAADLDRVLTAARSRGVRRVVWLTFARERPTDPGGTTGLRLFDHQNAVLRAAAERHHDLVAVDWAQAVRSRPSWVHADGIHFTNEGSYGNADFMSRAVAMVTGQPCPEAPRSDDEVCPDPGTTAPPDVRALYDFEDTSIQCWEVGPTRTPACVVDLYAR